MSGGAAGGVLRSAGGQRRGENQHLQDADRRREHHGGRGLRQWEQVGGESASAPNVALDSRII